MSSYPASTGIFPQGSLTSLVMGHQQDSDWMRGLLHRRELRPGISFLFFFFQIMFLFANLFNFL